jgi:hypothetical protein
MHYALPVALLTRGPVCIHSPSFSSASLNRDTREASMDNQTETTPTPPPTYDPNAACCTPAARATCCEPPEKAECCGDKPVTAGCGCQ